MTCAHPGNGVCFFYYLFSITYYLLSIENGAVQAAFAGNRFGEQQGSLLVIGGTGNPSPTHSGNA